MAGSARPGKPPPVAPPRLRDDVVQGHADAVAEMALGIRMVLGQPSVGPGHPVAAVGCQAGIS